MDNMELMESETATRAIDELKNVGISLLKEVANYLSKKDFSTGHQEEWIRFYGSLATDCGQIVLMDGLRNITPNDRKVFYQQFTKNMRENIEKFNKMREAK